MSTKKPDGFKNQFLFVIHDQWDFGFIRVTDIGYFPKADHHYRERPDGCDTAILLYCRQGSGSFCLGNNAACTLEAGQAVIIPPGIPHSYGACGEDPWSVYWVHFNGEILPFYMNLLGSCGPLFIAPQYDSDIVREFHRCFEILQTPYQTEEYYLVCQSVGNILALIAVGKKQFMRQRTQKGEKAVDKCLRYMKMNLSKAINLDELADIAGFSPSHLNLLFRKSTGKAPVDYFLHIKMQAASRDLFFTGKTITDIAADYGIYDPYYFSRLFKKVMGVSPTAYRKRAIG